MKLMEIVPIIFLLLVVITGGYFFYKQRFMLSDVVIPVNVTLPNNKPVLSLCFIKSGEPFIKNNEGICVPQPPNEGIDYEIIEDRITQVAMNRKVGDKG